MITDEIIKAALLGTDKYMPEPSVLLQETGAKIAALTTDKEDRLLKLAITTLWYEEAGRMPLKVENRLPECPPETNPEASEKRCSLVRSALLAKEDTWLAYLVYTIAKAGEVLSSDLVPLILDKALNNRKTAPVLIKICGQAGQWLCGLNTQWQVFFREEEENAWETGHIDQRKAYLENLRQHDPAMAVTLLEQTFASENAATRLAFLELLSDQLSPADEAFLQSLSKDKSQKVKETATAFLRRIQGSALNKRYLDYALNVIHIKEERHLLVYKKKTLELDAAVRPDEELFKTGIDKISRNKGVPDYIYILGQVLQDIDPAILAGRLDITDAGLIELLLAHKEAKHLLMFLTDAATTFRNKAWALALLAQPGIQDISLLDALPAAERPDFYGQFIDHNLPQLLTYILDDDYSTLSLPLSEALLQFLSRNPYQVTQPIYQRLALHLAAQAKPMLESFVQDTREDYQTRYFRTQALEMLRIIDLKNNLH